MTSNDLITATPCPPPNVSSWQEIRTLLTSGNDWIAVPKKYLNSREIWDLKYFQLRRLVDINDVLLCEYEHHFPLDFNRDAINLNFHVEDRPSGIEVSVDKLGQNELFVYTSCQRNRIAASNLYLITRFIRRHSLDLSLQIDIQYWNAMFAGDSFFSFQPMSRQSGVRQISRLLADESCHFDNSGRILINKSRSDFLPSTEQCLQILIEREKAAPQGDKPEYLNLSGGKDSRAVLKLMNAAMRLDNMRFYHQPRGSAICDMLTIAIADNYNKTLTAPKRRWVPLSFSESMAIFLEATAGRTFNYIPITRAAVDDYAVSVHYIGGTGEVYRFPYYLEALNKRGVMSIPKTTSDLSTLISRMFSKAYAGGDARSAFKEEVEEGLSTACDHYQTDDTCALLVGHYSLFRNRDHFQGNNRLRAFCNKQIFRFPLFLAELINHSVLFYQSNSWNGRDEIFNLVFDRLPSEIELPYDQDNDAGYILKEKKYENKYRSWLAKHKETREIGIPERYFLEEEISSFRTVADKLRESNLDIAIDWERFISGTTDLFERGHRSLARSSFAKCHALNDLREMIELN